eukprot:548602_1
MSTANNSSKRKQFNYSSRRSIDLKPVDIPIKNDPNVTVHYRPQFTCNAKELEYLQLMLWKTMRASWTNNVPAFITSWEDYAKHASNGKISDHFNCLSYPTNKKVSLINECLHHKFGGIEQCIQKLDEILCGSPQ